MSSFEITVDAKDIYSQFSAILTVADVPHCGTEVRPIFSVIGSSLLAVGFLNFTDSSIMQEDPGYWSGPVTGMSHSEIASIVTVWIKKTAEKHKNVEGNDKTYFVPDKIHVFSPDKIDKIKSNVPDHWDSTKCYIIFEIQYIEKPYTV